MAGNCIANQRRPHLIVYGRLPPETCPPVELRRRTPKSFPKSFRQGAAPARPAAPPSLPRASTLRRATDKRCAAQRSRSALQAAPGLHSSRSIPDTCRSFPYPHSQLLTLLAGVACRTNTRVHSHGPTPGQRSVHRASPPCSRGETHRDPTHRDPLHRHPSLRPSGHPLL